MITCIFYSILEIISHWHCDTFELLFSLANSMYQSDPAAF